jgi:hypothetical protein
LSFADYKEFGGLLPSVLSHADKGSEGYVYVIGFEEPGIIKIGAATCLSMRLSALQVGCPFELKLRAAISVYDASPFVVEFAAHKIAKENGSHIRGEWFNLEVDEALQIILDAARSKRVRYGSWHGARMAEEESHKARLADADEERRRILRVKLGMD